MTELNVNELVGESFEELSITEMTMVQGSGDIGVETTPTSPGCYASVIYVSRASSAACGTAVSAISSAVSGAVVSAFKC